MNSNNSVLVVDDHRLTCEMTSAYLKNEGGFTADYADTVEAAAEAIKSNGPYTVVLLDFNMPGMGGIHGVERFVNLNKPGSIVLFSGQVRYEVALRAIESGVRGFIPKDLPLKSLCNAINFVASGETYLPQSVASALSRIDRKRSPSAISEVEFDVMKGICRGQTNKDIARELGITEVAVKMHVRGLCNKLGATNRTQIALTAVSQGLV